METGTTTREMPRYRCHKEVHALKIKAINIPFIVPEDEGYAPFAPDPIFFKKHLPEVGGYYVLYDDGYTSYSPAKAFEDGYTRI